MKKYVVWLILFLLLATPVRAQLRSPLGRPLPPRKVAPPTPQPTPQPMPFPEQAKWNEPGELIEGGRHDLFIGPAFEFTQMNDAFGFLIGARGGWIINHRYVIGLSGFKLANDVPGDSLDSGARPDLSFQYGGLELEYILFPEDIVHFSFSTLVGVGFVGNDYGEEDKDDTTAVIKPSLNVIVNVTKFLRVGLGLGYRFTTDVAMANPEDEDLNGPVATLSLNFGTYARTHANCRTLIK